MTTYTDPGGRQFAFDPHTHPEYFDAVRRRRIAAFCMDFIAICLLSFAAGILVFFLGIFTFGLGWFLYGGIFPVIACLYTAMTLGGPACATPGMRSMNLEMRTWYGAPIYPLLALVHVLLFYFSTALLTPLVLVVSLFSDRKRLLHDVMVGTQVINSDIGNLRRIPD